MIKNIYKGKTKHDFKWWRNMIIKIAIYFVLICVGFVYLEPIFEIIAKTFMSLAVTQAEHATS
jgi:hypothetical protein